jgi:SAM-dependent methyltransferase
MPSHPLTPADVADLYARHVAVNDTPSYLTRYDGFDFLARFGEAATRRMEFPRLLEILEFERLIREHRITTRRVLMLSGGPQGDPELQYLPHESVDFCDFDTEPERCDLHRLALDDEAYDFALFSQTLEHLYDPVLALQNVRRVLEPGGHVWTSVPTVSFQHQLPHHFATGFTPIGLASLFAHTGFEILAIGQWGNAKYVSQLFDLDVIATLHDLRRGAEPIRGVRHLLRLLGRVAPAHVLADGTSNDFSKPVQTWALGLKPSR